MLTIEQIEELETVIEQMDSMYAEILMLTKKKANESLNKFKINLINSLLARCNGMIGAQYKPFDDFERFDPDELPSNSDVSVILSQYTKSLEMFRRDNIYIKDYSWYYDTDDGSRIIAAEPKLQTRKRRK